MTDRRRLRRSSAAGFVAVMGLIILGVVAYLLFGTSGPSEADRRAVEAYREAIRPFAVDGGRIVVTGMRPGLTDLSSGKVGGAEFRRMAGGWRGEMTRVRAGFASAKPPTAALKRAAALFDESLVGYLRAIDAFVAASSKTGKELEAAITAAVPVAENADKVYDRASDLVKAEFRRVGLPEPSTI